MRGGTRTTAGEGAHTHFPKRRPELPSVALWHSTRVPGCTIHSATQTGAGKEKSGWGTRVSWEGGGEVSSWDLSPDFAGCRAAGPHWQTPGGHSTSRPRVVQAAPGPPSWPPSF